MATYYDSRTDPNQEMRIFLKSSRQPNGALAEKYKSLPYINYYVPRLDASLMDQEVSEQFLREFEPLFDRLMTIDLGDKPIRLDFNYRIDDTQFISLIAFKHAYAVFRGDLETCLRCEAAMDRLIFLSNQPGSYLFGVQTLFPNHKYHCVQRRIEAGMGITEDLIDKRGSSLIWSDLISQAKEALIPEIFFFLRACDQNVYGSRTHEKLYFPASRDIDRRIGTEILQKRIGVAVHYTVDQE